MARCFQCGVMVDELVAAAQFGRCAECFARSDNFTPSSSAQKGAVVRASYRPPAFADRLVMWHTLVTDDRNVTQTIFFWDDAHRRHAEQRNATIAISDLSEIRAAFSELDRVGLRALRQFDDMTDVESIEITSFDLDCTEGVALYSMEEYAVQNSMNDAAISGLRSFRRLWNAIESVSPLTIRDLYATEWRFS